MQVYLKLRRGWREALLYVPSNYHFQIAELYRRFPAVWVPQKLMKASEIRMATTDGPVHIWLSGEDPKKVQPWKVTWAELFLPKS